MFTSLHYGDVHVPFHDPKALKVLYSIIEDLQPDLVVCHGDLLDCYSISNFQKDPKERFDLRAEIDAAKHHLVTVSDLAPDAERILLQGNHEDRLRRTIWNMAENPRAKEVLRLPAVDEALSWSNLLDLPGRGWEWVESKRVLFNRIILKHGTIVRKWSAYSAKFEMERYGKSGISGHTHRMGSFFHRDWNGQHGWWEHGCLCGLDPEYMEDPDWQQGILVVTWSDKKDRFSVEPIHIHKGRALFRGKEY